MPGPSEQPGSTDGPNTLIKQISEAEQTAIRSRGEQEITERRLAGLGLQALQDLLAGNLSSDAFVGVYTKTLFKFDEKGQANKATIEEGQEQGKRIKPGALLLLADPKTRAYTDLRVVADPPEGEKVATMNVTASRWGALSVFWEVKVGEDSEVVNVTSDSKIGKNVVDALYHRYLEELGLRETHVGHIVDLLRQAVGMLEERGEVSKESPFDLFPPPNSGSRYITDVESLNEVLRGIIRERLRNYGRADKNRRSDQELDGLLMLADRIDERITQEYMAEVAVSSVDNNDKNLMFDISEGVALYEARLQAKDSDEVHKPTTEQTLARYIKFVEDGRTILSNRPSSKSPFDNY